MVVGGGGGGGSCKNEENPGSCPAKANSQVGKSGLACSLTQLKGPAV